MADITGQLQAAAGVSTGNPNAWDISKAYYDAGADAGDISKAVYSSRTFSVAGQDTVPQGLYFKPDGTKLYMVGSTNDNVYEYTLSVPWIVSTATYVQSFSVATEDTGPLDLHFKPDGTKMYVVGGSQDEINEYSLSTAWDISTASYVQNFSVVTEEASPTGLWFKPDGTKMYIVGTTGDEVNEYDLSTPWDISTASYLQNFSVATEEAAPQAISFLGDGTKMYVMGNSGDDINQYDLSTPWDISTASYVTNFSVSGQETNPTGLYVKSDGSLFYVTGAVGQSFRQYTIGGFSVAAEEANPNALAFKPDGTKMYVCGIIGDDVNEYDLSTAWDISTASYVQNFSVASQDTAPVGLFFKPDGTKMYVLGDSDAVNEYSLSTPWDVSTASYVQNFSVAGEETVPQSVFFKSDGAKMYVLGSTGDDVNEYDLSTPWDVSTASYVQNFSVASQETVPTGLFFKPDGIKMYVIGTAGDDVNEYDLSTPWDISTASYVQNFFVYEELLPTAITWNPDGSQFFMIGTSFDRVFSYTISPE